MGDTRQGQNQPDRSTQTPQPERGGSQRPGNMPEQDESERKAGENPRRSGSTDPNRNVETGTDRQNEDVETGRTSTRTPEENI